MSSRFGQGSMTKTLQRNTMEMTQIQRNHVSGKVWSLKFYGRQWMLMKMKEENIQTSDSQWQVSLNRTKALVYFLGISVENSFKFYKLNTILLQRYLCFTSSVSSLYQIQGQNDFKLLYYKTWFFATLVSTLLSSAFTKVIWLLQQEVHLDHPWWRH